MICFAIQRQEIPSLDCIGLITLFVNLAESYVGEAGKSEEIRWLGFCGRRASRYTRIVKRRRVSKIQTEMRNFVISCDAVVGIYAEISQ